MSYNLLNPVHILQAVSMAASITSNPVEVKLQDNMGVQLHWTGAPVGVFGVQVSMDYREDAEGNVQNAGHWVSLPLSPSITASGSADDAYIDLTQLSAVYLRVTYTRTSGTGTVDAFVNAKGV
jgi:hypothetical protein